MPDKAIAPAANIAYIMLYNMIKIWLNYILFIKRMQFSAKCAFGASGFIKLKHNDKRLFF